MKKNKDITIEVKMSAEDLVKLLIKLEKKLKIKKK